MPAEEIDERRDDCGVGGDIVTSKSLRIFIAGF
jgi:hypothetical protein